MRRLSVVQQPGYGICALADDILVDRCVGLGRHTWSDFRAQRAEGELLAHLGPVRRQLIMLLTTAQTTPLPRLSLLRCVCGFRVGLRTPS